MTTPGFATNKQTELDEEGTRISLTIVDTPGFGDLIDNEARCVYIRHAMLDRGVSLANTAALQLL